MRQDICSSVVYSSAASGGKRARQILWLAAVLFFLPKPMHAQIGDTAPDFTAVDTHGDTIHLYDILDQGKYVILDFYYTTCGPCIYYTPQVNLAHEKYGCNTQDVVFIGIDYNDTNAEVQAYDAQYGIQYPSISGTQGGGNSVVSQYSIIGFPTFFLIDSTHHIIDQIDPPTLQVFDFRFDMHGIVPMECLSGTQEVAQPQRLRIFPNPATAGYISTDLSELPAGTVRLQVINILGGMVAQYGAEHSAGQAHRIPIDGIPPGVYQLRVVAANNRVWYGEFVLLEPGQ